MHASTGLTPACSNPSWRAAWSWLAAVILTAAAWAPCQDAPVEAWRSLQGLEAEWGQQRALASFGILTAPTPAVRKKFVEALPGDDWIARFEGLAGRYGGSRFRAECLVTAYPKASAQRRAALLERLHDHIDQPVMQRLCRDLRGEHPPQGEQFLRDLRAHSPHRMVQAHATWTLAVVLAKQRRNCVLLQHGLGDVERRLAASWSQDDLLRLRQGDVDALHAECLELLRVVERDFGDVAIDGTTMGRYVRRIGGERLWVLERERLDLPATAAVLTGFWDRWRDQPRGDTRARIRHIMQGLPARLSAQGGSAAEPDWEPVKDGWGRLLRLTMVVQDQGPIVEVRSAGPDGVWLNGDDIAEVAGI